jgi:hypothetical protein
MKSKLTMAFGSLIAASCLFTNGLSAWERTAMDECKQEMNDCKDDASQCTGDRAMCKRQAEQCKKDYEMCKKEVDQTDAASFANALSIPYYKTQFTQFSDSQRKRAMDYADGNKMKPDDAVAKVMKEDKGKMNNNRNGSGNGKNGDGNGNGKNGNGNNGY